MERRPRGWRLRSLLVAVALLAAILGWARYELTKPRPMIFLQHGAAPPGLIWSDFESHDRGPGIHPEKVQFGRLMTRVIWSDGVTTRHYGWPYR